MAERPLARISARKFQTHKPILNLLYIGCRFYEIARHPTRTDVNTMKKYLAFAAALTATSLGAIAGGAGFKTTEPPLRPCFADNELTVSAFGSYYAAETREPTNGDHGFGGGIEVKYFFARYVGAGVEGSLFDSSDDRALSFANLNIYFRYPMEGAVCWAPYLFGGGGGEWGVHQAAPHGHAGAGFEVRLAPNLGFFADSRYTWTGGPRVNNDFALIRTGVTLAF
jgi:hypothetical protein